MRLRSSHREAPPQEPEAHAQYENLRNPVERRAPACQQLIGIEHAQQRRHRACAEEQKRRHTLNRAATGNSGDDSGVKQPARKQAEGEPNDIRVTRYAPPESRCEAVCDDRSARWRRDIGKHRQRPHDERRACEKRSRALDAQQGATQFNDAAQGPGRSPQRGVCGDPPGSVPEVRGERVMGARRMCKAA